MAPPTARCVVVGNEILSGKIRDSNAWFLARWLRMRGVDLVGVEVIPDDVATIGDAVKRCSTSATYVFTSGGIGPTHDDMTYAGVAHGFGLPLRAHPDVVAAMTAHDGAPPNDIRLRMARMPDPCTLHVTPPWWVPVVQVHNVFILPGVPLLFEPLLRSLGGVIQGSTPITLASVYTRQREEDLAPLLEETLKHHAGLDIGSYPRMDRAADHRVRLTLESRDGALVQAALDWLCARMDAAQLVRVDAPATGPSDLPAG